MQRAASSAPRASASSSRIAPDTTSRIEMHGPGAHLDNLETHDVRRILPHTCFSVEPGIYLPEFGVRSEVNMLTAPGKAWVTGEFSRNWCESRLRWPSAVLFPRSLVSLVPSPCCIVNKECRPRRISLLRARNQGRDLFICRSSPDGWFPARVISSRANGCAGRCWRFRSSPCSRWDLPCRGSSTPAQQDILGILGMAGDLGSGLLYIVSRAAGLGAQPTQTTIADYGKVFIVVAGLLNVIAAVDAHNLRTGRKQ